MNKKIDTSSKEWRKKIIKDPALWITLVVAILIVSFGDESILRSAMTQVGVSLIQMGAAFLGIVIAALAILIVFLDKKYIAIFQHFNVPFETQLRPFRHLAIAAIVCLGFGMALLLFGEPPTAAFRFVFGAALWSFGYLLSQLFELVKFLIEHARTRMKQIESDKEENRD